MNYSDDRRDNEVIFNPDAFPKPLQGVVTDPRKLDNSLFTMVHSELVGMFTSELQRQAASRAEMQMDEAFYDNKQWSDDELLVLASRGQAPLTFNVIASAINYMLGMQRRAPKDFRVLPRRKDGLAASQLKTELLKYVSDTSNAHAHYAKAFKDLVRAGIGWLETGHMVDYDREPVFEGWESWRNVLWDSSGQADDLSDGRYLFRSRWTDLDSCVAKFPKRQRLLEESCQTSYVMSTTGNNISIIDAMGDDAMDAREYEYWDQADYVLRPGTMTRRRLRLVEGWYKRTMTTDVIKGGDFSGEIYDPWSRGHYADLDSGRAKLMRRPRQIMHVAVFTDKGLLYHGPTPYRHNRFPLTPMWANRDAETGMPYGMIRHIRDAQRDLNKRLSKSLHILSSARVFYEKTTDVDVEELRDEAARPDAMIGYAPGGKPPTVETDYNLSQAHIGLMGMDMDFIQNISGVTDENMGRETNASSGKAIIARQTEGQLSTSHYFEAERSGRKHHGDKLLSLIEQFFSEHKMFRITNMRGNPDWEEINVVPGDDISDITMTKADFVLDETDWSATARQAQAETLLDLMTKLAATAPEIVIATLDLVVEALDVPKQEELVKRIRQVTGQNDPDADPENPDEETMALQAQRDAQAAMQARAAEAELASTEAKAMETAARAKKTQAETRKTLQSLASGSLEDIKKSLEVAIQMIGAPAVADAADQILYAAQRSAESAAQPQGPMPPEQPPQPIPA
ncbi:hypothetical protein [uncultured Roseobacter sp.]|uniref:portal protein n=1 Tax=uncultured Roseobacter sp. TaxID=114847 RepID=UPI00261D0B5B|nr:hypothetical protein [uncultured Roseobacter sp.]